MEVYSKVRQYTVKLPRVFRHEMDMNLSTAGSDRLFSSLVLSYLKILVCWLITNFIRVHPLRLWISVQHFLTIHLIFNNMFQSRPKRRIDKSTAGLLVLSSLELCAFQRHRLYQHWDCHVFLRTNRNHLKDYMNTLKFYTQGFELSTALTQLPETWAHFILFCCSLLRASSSPKWTWNVERCRLEDRHVQ